MTQLDKSSPSLVKADGSNTPVGSLSAYNVASSAIPIDPRDTSGQVPTFSATLTSVEGDAKALAEQDVTLTDWTRTVSSGRIAAVNRSVESGLVTLDMNTIYERLNTEQTTLPIVMPDYGGPVNAALDHWMLMAGVPRKRWEGNIQTCIQASWTDNYGYLANSTSKLRRKDMEQSYYEAYIPTIDTYMAPLDINAAQSIVFGVQFWAGTVLSESRWHVYVPETEQTVRYTLGRNNHDFYFKQKIGTAAETTLMTVSYTPVYTSEVYCFLKIAAGNSATNVTFSMRLMEYNFTTENTEYADAVLSNVTAPLLRKRPKPFKIEVGWDTALQSGGVPTGAIPDAIVLTDVLPTDVPKNNASFNFNSANNALWPTQIPGYTANVWDKIREFCALLEIDIFFKDDILNFSDRGYRRTDSGGNYIPVLNVAKSNLVEAVSARETARAVEVDYREMDGTWSGTYYPGNSLLWKADSVYSLEKGEKKVEVIEADVSIVYLNQPVAVSGVPVPYTSAFGSYVITGNDGYIVDPQWWKDNGGSITVKPTGAHGQIELTMQAPTIDTVRAPYRVSEGVADRPALYIFGKGLKLKPAKTVKVFTGYPDSAQDVGVKFESPFVVTKLMAFNAGHKLANGYGSTDTTISFDSVQSDMDKPIDSIAPLTFLNDSVYWDGSHYRIADQVVSHGSITVGTAERHNTIAGVNGEFATGKTIADWNALHAGKVIRDTNIAPLPRYVG